MDGPVGTWEGGGSWKLYCAGRDKCEEMAQRVKMRESHEECLPRVLWPRQYDYTTTITTTTETRTTSSTTTTTCMYNLHLVNNYYDYWYNNYQYYYDHLFSNYCNTSVCRGRC